MLKQSLESLRQEASESGNYTLKRSLNAFNLIVFGIGVIGAGLFFLTDLLKPGCTPTAENIALIPKNIFYYLCTPTLLYSDAL